MYMYISIFFYDHKRIYLSRKHNVFHVLKELNNKVGVNINLRIDYQIQVVVL